mgnify:CR=1 FL=1
MLTSFLLSRTFVPMMCANFLPDEHLHSSVAAVAKKSGRLLQILDRFQSVLDRLTQRYLSLLDWSLEHRATVIFGVVLLFVLSLGLLKGIGREFFPQVDAGQITLHLRSPSNLRLDASENRVKQVEQFLKENIPALEREMIVSEIGLNPDGDAILTTFHAVVSLVDAIDAGCLFMAFEEKTQTGGFFFRRFVDFAKH